MPATGRDDRGKCGSVGCPRWYFRLNVALAGSIASLILLAQWTEATPQGLRVFGRRVPETCLVKTVTGRRCPGCGTSRSAVLALQLRLARSARTHPSGIYVAAWLVGQVVLRVLMVTFRPARRRVHITDLAVSLATLCLAANLPWILSGQQPC